LRDQAKALVRRESSCESVDLKGQGVGCAATL
jgi:hypothetical protein